MYTWCKSLKKRELWGIKLHQNWFTRSSQLNRFLLWLLQTENRPKILSSRKESRNQVSRKFIIQATGNNPSQILLQALVSLVATLDYREMALWVKSGILPKSRRCMSPRQQRSLRINKVRGLYIMVIRTFRANTLTGQSLKTILLREITSQIWRKAVLLVSSTSLKSNRPLRKFNNQAPMLALLDLWTPLASTAMKIIRPKAGLVSNHSKRTTSNS